MRTHNLGGGLFFVAAVDDGDDGLGEIQEGHSGHGVAKGGGLSTVATVTDDLYQRDLRLKGNTEFLGQLLAAFLSEDVVAVVREFGRGKPRHVLYQT